MIFGTFNLPPHNPGILSCDVQQVIKYPRAPPPVPDVISVPCQHCVHQINPTHVFFINLHRERSWHAMSFFSLLLYRCVVPSGWRRVQLETILTTPLWNHGGTVMLSLEQHNDVLPLPSLFISLTDFSFASPLQTVLTMSSYIKYVIFIQFID